MTRPTIVLLLAACALGLAACGEKPQTASKKKSDVEPWQGAQSAAFNDPNWKAGDQTAWETQIRTRAQGQNEYTRTPPAAK